jgi:hypothetical protein
MQLVLRNFHAILQTFPQRNLRIISKTSHQLSICLITVVLQMFYQFRERRVSQKLNHLRGFPIEVQQIFFDMKSLRLN